MKCYLPLTIYTYTSGEQAFRPKPLAANGTAQRQTGPIGEQWSRFDRQTGPKGPSERHGRARQAVSAVGPGW
jgi:hypothetical protein